MIYLTIILAFSAVNQFLSVFFYCYIYLEKPCLILIQNPPAIPTILLARSLSFFLGSPLVIDWHNFGFSIMVHYNLDRTDLSRQWKDPKDLV